MSYWTSPRGILQRARDKANPYKTAASRDAFCDGWTNAAGQTEEFAAKNAYAKGWNARIQHERATEADLIATQTTESDAP